MGFGVDGMGCRGGGLGFGFGEGVSTLGSGVGCGFIGVVSRGALGTERGDVMDACLVVCTLGSWAGGGRFHVTRLGFVG